MAKNLASSLKAMGKTKPAKAKPIKKAITPKRGKK